MESRRIASRGTSSGMPARACTDAWTVGGVRVAAVPIRRQPRDSQGIGSVKLLSALDLPTVASRTAGAVDSIEEFADRLAGAARASLKNPSRLHGLRGEAMFRAVLVALGDFQLLVEEDEGQLYYDDSGGAVKQPDYRTVDSEGRQILIEVKTVPPTPRRLRHSIPATEARALRRYGELTSTPVTIAHYWSALNVWTLVDLDLMRPNGRRHELELTEAIRANQMGRFGDRTIGTVPPLALHLEVEEIAKRTAPDTATVAVRTVQMLAAGRPIVDPVEQRIAFVLFRFGNWPIDTPAGLDSNGKLASVTLEAAPPEEVRDMVARQGLAMVGALSSMYSALFNEITLDDEGAVRRLDHHSEPGELGSLIPTDYFECPNRNLRLWVLHLQPTSPDQQDD